MFCYFRRVGRQGVKRVNGEVCRMFCFSAMSEVGEEGFHQEGSFVGERDFEVVLCKVMENVV